MPYVVDGAPYVNKAPLFFCAAHNGTGSHDFEKPSVWPRGSVIRVRIRNGETVHSEIVKVVKDAVTAWNAVIASAGVKMEWLGFGDSAEVLISFRNDLPNFSALGNTKHMFDTNGTTMNFNLAGWADQRKTVYRRQDIEKAANHLFGHAVGLPHAEMSFSTPWNETELLKWCGPKLTPYIKSMKGSDELQNPESVMGFDRPGSLGTGIDERRGGHLIDDEAKALVSALYSRAVCRGYVQATRVPGWTGGRRRPAAVRSFVGVAETANIVTGFSRIDLGTDGWFRLEASSKTIISGSQFDIKIESKLDTYITDATSVFLCFDDNDRRVQTGRVNLREEKGGNEMLTNADGWWSKVVYFPKRFERLPKVTVFITGLDVSNQKYVSIEVAPQEISYDKFTLGFRAFDSCEVWDLQVSWLAHLADEPTIRSGILTTNESNVSSNTLHTTKSHRATFDKPLPCKPRDVFLAFSYLELFSQKPMQVECGVTSYDRYGVEGKFSTWNDDSKWYNLKGSYVAFT